MTVLPSGEIPSRWEALSIPADRYRVTQADAPRLIELAACPSRVLCLDPQAKGVLERQGCAVTLAHTPEAIELYDASEGPVPALFHLTCERPARGVANAIPAHRPRATSFSRSAEHWLLGKCCNSR